MPEDSRTSDERNRRRPLWRRTWVRVAAGLLLLLIVVPALGDPEVEPDQAPRDPATTPAPAPDPAVEAREAATLLVEDSDYLGAIGVLEEVGLEDAAARVRRRGTRTLVAAARRGVRRGRYEAAKADALDARQLGRHSTVAAVLAQANSGIARERAAARERRRQARIARDLRTCTAGEKDAVRVGSGIPPGCTAYAADLEARRLAREAERAAAAAEEAAAQEPAAQDPATAGCAPGYDPCVPSFPPDVDCPDVGPVTVSGPDPHGLDADGDGVACGGD